MTTNLLNLNAPAQYTGGEVNAIVKQGVPRFALCFPDSYDVGMSHVGSKILYHVVNIMPDWACERAFAPRADREAQLREVGEKLATLESNTPLCDCQAIGFSLQYELSYTNVLLMLELGGIPQRRDERTDAHPIVIAGGPCTTNPMPLVDFIDVFAIGDGEEILPELLAAMGPHTTRADKLTAAAQVPGAYVPDYNKGAKRRIIEDLDAAPYPTAPVVPYVQAVHDRAVIEVFRGCSRGCRFCQAGMIYRPVRERKVGTLLRQAKEQLASTGYDELGLCSLSTADYSQVDALLGTLSSELTPTHTSLSLPSTRMDALQKAQLDELAAVRKSGLTFAPEAGTQRLRDVINKNVTQEDIDRTLTHAFSAGWNRVKLYFMIGLPTETQEDLQGIADMARGIRKLFNTTPCDIPRKGLAVSVSASTFVPKAGTPFARCPQISREQIQEKQEFLRRALKIPGVTFSSHDSSTSVLESAFARGGQELCNVLARAYASGCRFDGWRETFRFDVWQHAFAGCGLDLDACATRSFAPDEPLPWAPIDIGVSQEFLDREYAAAMATQTTPDCREGCRACGLQAVCTKLPRPVAVN